MGDRSPTEWKQESHACPRGPTTYTSHPLCKKLTSSPPETRIHAPRTLTHPHPHPHTLGPTICSLAAPAKLTGDDAPFLFLFACSCCAYRTHIEQQLLRGWQDLEASFVYLYRRRTMAGLVGSLSLRGARESRQSGCFLSV